MWEKCHIFFFLIIFVDEKSEKADYEETTYDRNYGVNLCVNG